MRVTCSVRRAVCVVLACMAVCACGDPVPGDILALINALPIKPSCRTSTRLMSFTFQCVPKLYTKIMPVINDVQTALRSPCMVDPQNVTAIPTCSVDELNALQASLVPLVKETKDLVNTLCDESSPGSQKSCYNTLLELIKECADDSVKQSLPDGLDVDEVIDAANLLCDKNPQQESCGVKILEMFIEQQEVLSSSSACASLANGTCSEDCRTFMKAFEAQLGCCWADLMNTALILKGSTDSVSGEASSVLPELHGAWRLCGVTEPATTCDGKKTLKYDSDGNAVEDPSKSGFTKKHHSAAVIAGAIAGIVGGAAVVIVVALLLLKRRRATAVYLPVQRFEDTEDETMVSL